MKNKKICFFGIILTFTLLLSLISVLNIVKKENYILSILFFKKEKNNSYKLFLKLTEKIKIKEIKEIKTFNSKYFFKLKKEQKFLNQNLIELINEYNLILKKPINIKIFFKKETILFFLYKMIFNY